MGNPAKLIENLEKGFFLVFEIFVNNFIKNPLDPLMCITKGFIEMIKTWTLALFESLFLTTKSVISGL